MKRFGYLRLAAQPACWVLFLSLALCISSTLHAQPAPNPDDFALEMRLDKAGYKPGDTIKATAGIVAKKAGIQGWSYGGKHDTALLDIEGVTIDGTDVPALFDGGFNTTRVVDSKGTNVGYIQAIILSFVNPVEVPISDYFKMCAATYKVKANACDGKSGDVKSKIEFAHKELAVQGSPPVDINLTIGGVALGPEQGLRTTGIDAVIQCGVTPPPGGLVLKFEQSDTDLVADKSSTYDIKVHLGNTAATGKTDAQGWSYGIQVDADELEALKGEPGVDSKALKGGKGPDFVNYNLTDQSADGTIKGITVGAVIELGEPGTAVLSVPAGSMKHIDTVQVRSKKEIAQGGASRKTTISFTDKLGGDRPLEVLIVVAGEGVVPDFTDKLELTLLPKAGPGDEPKFIRGDANNDARVDIADGIWIINTLFYGGAPTNCKPAADSNGDGKRDLSDAMFVFQHQLQPGATPSTLFPAPPAPYPNCGTAAGVTLADCPIGSSTCTQ